MPAAPGAGEASGASGAGQVQAATAIGARGPRGSGVCGPQHARVLPHLVRGTHVVWTRRVEGSLLTKVAEQAQSSFLKGELLSAELVLCLLKIPGLCPVTHPQGPSEGCTNTLSYPHLRGGAPSCTSGQSAPCSVSRGERRVQRRAHEGP